MTMPGNSGSMPIQPGTREHVSATGVELRSINITQVEIAIRYWRRLASASVCNGEAARMEYDAIVQTLADLYRRMVTERRTMIPVGDLSVPEWSALATVCRLTETVPEEA